MKDLSALVGRYVTSDKEQTYVIQLPDGEEITCRRLLRYGDVARFETEADEFWSRVQEGGLVPAASAFAPQNADEARAAFTLMFHSCDPTKFDEVAACRLLEAPWVMSTLVKQIVDRQARDVFESVASKVAEGKGPSEKASGSDSEPSSPTVSTASSHTA